MAKEGRSRDIPKEKKEKSKKASQDQQQPQPSAPVFCFPSDLAQNDAQYTEKIFPESGTKELISENTGRLNKYILITNRGDFMKIVEDVKEKGLKRTTLKYANGKIVKSLYNKRNGDEKICTTKSDGKILVTEENKFHNLKTATLYDQSGLALEEILMDKNDSQMVRILEGENTEGKEKRGKPGGKSTAGKPHGSRIHVQIYRKHRDLKTDDEKGARKTQTRNNGIVADQTSVIVNGFHGYPSKPVDLSELMKNEEIEKISENEGRVNDANNFGYLVHFSPTGRHWRTKNMDLIKKILKGDHTIINDGGYTEYFDSKRGWSKNDGIIENGKFVPKSTHFHDRGAYFEYQWGGNVLRWTKVSPKESDDFDLDEGTDLIPRTHSHITNSASGSRANSRTLQTDPLTRPNKHQLPPDQAKQSSPDQRKARSQQTDGSSRKPKQSRKSEKKTSSR